MKLNMISIAHLCTSTINNATIVYRCTKCPGWELSQNIETGEIQRNAIAQKSMILHKGSASGYPDILENQN